jgi:hypothetical protein
MSRISESVLVMVFVFGAPTAVNADTGKTSWHASGDYQEHACDAARLGALQNAPNKAKVVDGGKCSCSKNASGRIDCWVMIIWETPTPTPRH